MKIIVKPVGDINDYQEADGFVLPLKDFAVDYRNYYDLNSIIQIANSTDKEIFVVINKMISNREIDDLKKVLLDLEKIDITGIFFYDLALLQLKKELGLKNDLVWNNTHMVTNYYTCNYYYDKGIKYAYLSNEITIDEVLEINKKAKTKSIFMLLGYPVVSFSKRSLVSNSGFKDEIKIREDTSKQQYMVIESNDGTTFKYDKIRNNAVCLKQLVDNNFPYVYLIEDDINHEIFKEGLVLTRNLIDGKIENNMYVKKMRELFHGDTGFLYRKTIYRVKK